jgi:hypothetical protein
MTVLSCYACDDDATGTCDRTRFSQGATVPACDRHRDDRYPDRLMLTDVQHRIAESWLDGHPVGPDHVATPVAPDVHERASDAEHFAESTLSGLIAVRHLSTAPRCESPEWLCMALMCLDQADIRCVAKIARLLCDELESGR